MNKRILIKYLNRWGKPASYFPSRQLISGFQKEFLISQLTIKYTYSGPYVFMAPTDRGLEKYPYQTKRMRWRRVWRLKGMGTYKK